MKGSSLTPPTPTQVILFQILLDPFPNLNNLSRLKWSNSGDEICIMINMLETTVSKLPLLVWSSQGSYCLGTVWPAGSPIPNKTPRLLCSANHGTALLIVHLQFEAAFWILELFCGVLQCLSSVQPMMVQPPFKFLQTNCSPSTLSSAQPMMVQPPSNVCKLIVHLQL